MDILDPTVSRVKVALGMRRIILKIWLQANIKQKVNLLEINLFESEFKDRSKSYLWSEDKKILALEKSWRKSPREKILKNGIST